MLFIRTTLHGAEINCIFNGEFYYFHNSYFGIIGIAKRAGYENEEQERTFELITGNEYCIGGTYTPATVEMMMKKVITKNENKYTKKVCKYLHCSLPLHGYGLKIDHLRH